MGSETTFITGALSTQAVEDAFKSHFQGLLRYAHTIIRDELMAEEMVQNVFYKLWKNREDVGIDRSISAYLYRSVYHECLNHLKHLKVKAAYQAHAARAMENLNNAADKLRLKELEEKLETALKELPEQCRTIFQMSRFEELKYMEIAGRLGISVKTVENQMGKALKLLRSKLADLLPIFFIFLFNL
ncbi:RNA polymerase sigma-70 factor [Nemorincola caseinilytica]|uniref:RNA polymerase sigma-70 factor n=1 Tax=Nemorincola caseinilytica TaxID=2054315 RepID=A0ABP8N7D6_9BACT